VPIFEYICSKCDNEFEEIVLSKSAKIRCPDCGGGRVKKKPSAFGFRSKGSGNGGQAKFQASGGSGCSGCTSSNCSGCS
jgi:putative FmdB family regulatory protein